MTSIVGSPSEMLTSFTFARRTRLTKCLKFQDSNISCLVRTAAATWTASLTIISCKDARSNVILCQRSHVGAYSMHCQALQKF